MESKLLDIPLDVFTIIFEQLPRPAQASLALTCKGLFELCKSVLESSWMQSRNANISRPQSWSYYYSKLADENLMEFLILLESESWLYCASCFKLHPPQEFDKAALEMHPHERSCQWPGVVVFPCYYALRSDLSFCLSRPNDHALPRIYEYDIPEVGTSISTVRTVELFRGSTEQAQSLRAVVFYWIRLTWPEIFEGSWIPVMLCPHIGLFDILCQEDCPAQTICAECGTEVTASFSPAGENWEYWIEATINLDVLLHPGSFDKDLWRRLFRHALRSWTPRRAAN